MTLKKFLMFHLAQFCGSILAGFMLWLQKEYGFDNDTRAQTMWLGYPHANKDAFGIGNCLICEIMGTFFLCWVILMIGFASSFRPNNDVFGICIGGTVGICVLSFGPISGACLNPHRFIGPAIISGELWHKKYAEYWWIYIVGPYLGGTLAGLTYYFGYVDWNEKEHNKYLDDQKTPNQSPQKKLSENFETELQEQKGLKENPNGHPNQCITKKESDMEGIKFHKMDSAMIDH